MLLNRMTEQLTARLLRALEGMAGQMQALEESEVELTKAQRRVLYHLAQRPRRMTEIAAVLGSSLSSATSMVDRLVEKGLVERAADPADRRVVLCRFTSQGLEEARRQVRFFEEVAERLDEGELERVVEALELLAGAMEHEGKAGTRSSRRRRGGSRRPRP